MTLLKRRISQLFSRFYTTVRSPLERRRISRRFYIFGFLVLVFGLTQAAHADAFGYTIADVFAHISENVKETNDIIAAAFEFAQTSPYDVVNGIAGTSQGEIATTIITASKTAALAIASLLLMVEFLRKTVNFEWSSKWENVLVFLVQLIVVKQVVQNADVILGYTYSFFNTINDGIIGEMSGFLPYTATGNGKAVYVLTVERTFADDFSDSLKWLFTPNQWLNFDELVESFNEQITYTISQPAVNMFYPSVTDMSNAFANGQVGLTINSSELETFFGNPNSYLGFSPTLELILLQPYFLVMKAIAYIVFVITIGRVFELTLYTLFAPLPLSTFASSATHDVGKNFLKNYIAVVLQIAVIGAMFVVFYAINHYFIENLLVEGNSMNAIRLVRFIILIAFGMSVIKSGSWSKKICGVG